ATHRPAEQQAGAIRRVGLAALDLPNLAASFWTPNGLRLPSAELVAATRGARLPVMDDSGGRRTIVLMTIASEFAFQRMFGSFVSSLASITFPLRNGTVSSLARHLVVNVMNAGSMDSCTRVAGQYGAWCVNYSHRDFAAGNFDTHSNDFYGIGFTKTATILDGLSLGLDVLFLDADQTLFRNPLPYLLARQVDVLVTGDCHNHDDRTPADRLPPVNNNIGFVYFRSTAMVTRAVYNWGLHLANIARRGEKPWDQLTFGGAMEFISLEVSVRHLSLGMLRPDLFPYLCMATCGCNLRGVPLLQNGLLAKLNKNESTTPHFYYCDAELMQDWYAFHFPCATDMNGKAALMAEYSLMYQKVVGPLNSRSGLLNVLV
ncbi:hypothetical protein TSOC_006659, partial [Tetrabaena socialis]